MSTMAAAPSTLLRPPQPPSPPLPPMPPVPQQPPSPPRPDVSFDVLQGMSYTVSSSNANTGVLQKTSPSSRYYEYAASSEAATLIEGRCAPSGGTNCRFGLFRASSAGSLSSMVSTWDGPYATWMHGGGAGETVCGSLSARSNSANGYWTPSSLFRVQVSGGAVNIYRDGTLLRSCAGAVNGEMRAWATTHQGHAQLTITRLE